MYFDARTELEQMKEKVNKLERVMYGSIVETPIYKTLCHNEVLIISKDNKGVLVARNQLGFVHIERVKYPDD